MKIIRSYELLTSITNTFVGAAIENISNISFIDLHSSHNYEQFVTECGLNLAQISNQYNSKLLSESN